LAIDIPKLRTFMHLDTVFTMVDYDKFTIHPNIQNTMQIYVISKNNDDSKIAIKQESGSLEDIIKNIWTLIISNLLSVEEIAL